MIINLSVDTLVKYQLSATQFVILELLFEKKYNTLEKFLLNEGSMNDLEVLRERGYIITYDPEKPLDLIVLDISSVKKVLEVGDSDFWELFSTYPIKVPGRYGGTRYLRPTSINALETQKCKKKYDSIVRKKKTLHSHIMRCLKAELFMRTKSNSLQFMSELETYLNQRGWEKYEYLVEQANKQQVRKEKYGEGLL